jgi:hypothetical protein
MNNAELDRLILELGVLGDHLGQLISRDIDAL